MLSRQTQNAIRTAWRLYALPFGSDAENRVQNALATLSVAPELGVAGPGTEAMAFWTGFRATCADSHPKLAAARLRGVDLRLKDLVRKVESNGNQPDANSR